METKSTRVRKCKEADIFFSQMQLFSSFSYFYFNCYGEIKIVPTGLSQCNALSARNMPSKQLFSWQHDITMNETDILGVRLRDFVKKQQWLVLSYRSVGIKQELIIF